MLQLLAAGLSNQEIADRLIITLGTVKSHVDHSFGKLGVQGRVKAINCARQGHRELGDSVRINPVANREKRPQALFAVSSGF